MPSGVRSARVAGVTLPIGMIVAEKLHDTAGCCGGAGSGNGGSRGMISFNGTGSVSPAATAPIAHIANAPTAILIAKRLMAVVLRCLPQREVCIHARRA